MLLNALKHKQLHHIVQKSRSHRNNVSPADECGNDDAPSGAAAVSARLLGVHMGVWGLITLAPPAAKPERVEKEENKVQAQTQQCHSTEEQNRLRKEWEKKQLAKTRHLWFLYSLCYTFSIKLCLDSFRCIVFERFPLSQGSGPFRMWVKEAN